MPRVLGVDPGAGGALALLDTDLEALAVWDMPVATIVTGRTKRRQINDTQLAHMLALYQPDVAYVERVHALPKQGVTSCFTFGMAYGMVRGILAALNVPTHLITPQEYKKHFRVGPDKQHSRLVASRLFPQNSKDFSRARDDGRAEAALLALFGSTQHG